MQVHNHDEVKYWDEILKGYRPLSVSGTTQNQRDTISLSPE